MKKAIKALMILGLTLGVIKTVEAGQYDNIHVTIAPNASYDVTIATDNVGLALGTVDLSASTQTVLPATVTINSTYALTDLTLTGSVDGGWSFDTSSGSVVADELAAWVVFTGVNHTSAPVADAEYFNGTAPGTGSDMVSGAAQDVGFDGTLNNVFEVTQGPHIQDMDELAPAEQAHMFMYFRMPSASATNGTKNINFLLTAGAVVD